MMDDGASPLLVLLVIVFFLVIVVVVIAIATVGSPVGDSHIAPVCFSQYDLGVWRVEARGKDYAVHMTETEYARYCR